MSMIKQTSETSYVGGAVAPKMNSSDVRTLLASYEQSPRRRHRYCFHQSHEVDLHDIVIAYDGGSYIPPNKHVGKSESLLVLRGEIDLYLFNDCGQVFDRRRLSATDPEHPFYVRIPPNTWHGLRAIGKGPCIIKETISGPYDRSSLKWAEFAPQEGQDSQEGFRWYDDIHQRCETEGIRAPADEVFERVNEIVFRSTRQLVTVKRYQLNPIIDASRSSPLRRARLCCHASDEDKLQEMLIALSGGVEIDESVHIGKDESLTVLEGRGVYQFPNEDGSVRHEIALGRFDSEMECKDSFFARINRHVTHKIIVPADGLLIHEATSGPFRRSDTAYRIKRVSL
jgi:cupin fold WbuC family metalloprotein